MSSFALTTISVPPVVLPIAKTSAKVSWPSKAVETKAVVAILVELSLDACVVASEPLGKRTPDAFKFKIIPCPDTLVSIWVAVPVIENTWESKSTLPVPLSALKSKSWAVILESTKLLTAAEVGILVSLLLLAIPSAASTNFVIVILSPVSVKEPHDKFPEIVAFVSIVIDPVIKAFPETCKASVGVIPIPIWVVDTYKGVLFPNPSVSNFAVAPIGSLSTVFIIAS